MHRFQTRRNGPSVLAATLLALVSVVGVMAHASPAAAREAVSSPPSDNSPRTNPESPAGRTFKVTLRSGGKVVATLTVAQEEGAQMACQGNMISSHAGTRQQTITLTGNVTIKITRGQTTILSLTADEASVETVQEEK